MVLTMLGGGGRIRTIEANRNRFTVCPLWPLGNSPIWSFMSESNQQPADYKSAALPLSQWSVFGGNNRDRTCDPLLVRQMLSQLSYASIITIWNFNGGGGRIRTIEANRNRFTVCPLWPLGNSPIYLITFVFVRCVSTELTRISI